MTDLICRKSMTRCQTPGMCAPHGGCQPAVEVNIGKPDLGQFVDWAWKLKTERDQLKAFAIEMVNASFEGGSFDGGDIQDIAVKHGLLRIEQREGECGEGCACREYGFPAECYRKTPFLGAPPEEVATLSTHNENVSRHEGGQT